MPSSGGNPVHANGAEGLTLKQFQDGIESLVERLGTSAPQLLGDFADAKPFPHVVIDDFLPGPIAEQVYAEFPEPDTEIWRNLKGYDQGGKQVLGNDRFLATYSRALMLELNSGAMIRVLERITGINNLVADAKLLGGGLHQIKPGGRLNLHVDYSHHPETQLDRRLNLLIYLNKDWREEYGGHLELWDKNIKQCEKRVLPVFNRCVIFATTSSSYHGHPEPLTCPPGMTRKSIALYYYSLGRPEEPGQPTEHNTLFYQRPGEPLSLRNALLRAASSSWLKDLMPPIFYRGLRQTWNAVTLTRK